MPKHCTTLRPFIYADDMALLASGNDLNNIQNTLQSEFDYLLKWFHANKLSINAKKTKICVYCSKRSQLKNDPIEIRIGNEILEEVDTMKYLGVNIDKHLSFDKHTDSVVHISNQRTRLLWKMRSYISEDLAKYLYTTLFIHCSLIVILFMTGPMSTTSINSRWRKITHFVHSRDVIGSFRISTCMTLYKLTI